MFSKTVLSLALLVLLGIDTSGAADNKVSVSIKGTGAGRIARRGGRILKDKTKKTKSTKDEPKDPLKETTKAPKVTNAPTQATKVPTNASTMVQTKAPVLASTSSENATTADTDAMTDTNATDTNSIDTNSTCVIDSDCGPNWFCMEMASRCCQYNTTCRIESDEASVTTSASPFSNVYGIMASVAILSVVMW